MNDVPQFSAKGQAFKEKQETAEYRVVYHPTVAVRDVPWGKVVGTRKAGDTVKATSKTIGLPDGTWVKTVDQWVTGSSGKINGWMLIDGTAINLGTLLEKVEKGRMGMVKRYQVVAASTDIREKPALAGVAVVGSRKRGQVVRVDQEVNGWVRLQADFYHTGSAEPVEGWTLIHGGCAPARTCTHGHTWTHMHTHAHTCTHMHTNAHTHTYTHTRTHSHAHTTHARTHTHTYIHIYIQRHRSGVHPRALGAAQPALSHHRRRGSQGRADAEVGMHVHACACVHWLGVHALGVHPRTHACPRVLLPMPRELTAAWCGARHAWRQHVDAGKGRGGCEGATPARSLTLTLTLTQDVGDGKGRGGCEGATVGSCPDE
mgnify:CR=1 FL=1